MNIRITTTTEVTSATGQTIVSVTTEHRHTGGDNPRFAANEARAAHSAAAKTSIDSLVGALNARLGVPADQDLPKV